MLEFDADFEKEILSRCLDDAEYLRSAVRIMDRRALSTAPAEWCWKVIKETWDEHGELVDPKIFTSRAGFDFPGDDRDSEREAALEYVLKLYRTKPEASKSALDELRKFVEYTAITNGIDLAMRRLEKHDTHGARDQLKQLVEQDFKPRARKVVEWIEEFQQRQEQRKLRRDEPERFVCIPTGIPRLDRVMDGLRGGEFGLVMGTTGRGKSIFLTHLGFHAISRGYRVLHLSLEMEADLVSTRYDSRWSGVLHKSFKTYGFTEEDFEILNKKYALAKARFKKRLRIISMPVGTCDMNAIRFEYEDACASMGGPVQMVLIDSCDHVKAAGNYRDPRHAHAEVYWASKGFATDTGTAVWTSTHAGKEYADRIAGAEAAAESYDKARIADAVLTLNQPLAPKKKEAMRASLVASDDEPFEIAPADERPRAGLELFLAKLRDAESKIRIPLASDLARMLIREAEREEAEAASE